MELDDALLKIHAIQEHVSRTEMFRGYRAVTVGCTGLLALGAAATQGLWVPSPQHDPLAFVRFWVAIAAVSVTIVGLELAASWVRTDSHLARRQTLLAVEQFVPCIVAGGALTWTLVQNAPELLFLLPGLWAIIFSLGMFSSARQLPPAIRLVAAYYLVSGITVIAWCQGSAALSPWTMGATFGVGQLMAAAVLYFNLERGHAQR